MEGVDYFMYPLLAEGYIDVGNDSYISVDNFELRYGTIEEHNFSYDYFINHEKTIGSWKSIFEDWKEKGILN